MVKTPLLTSLLTKYRLLQYLQSRTFHSVPRNRPVCLSCVERQRSDIRARGPRYLFSGSDKGHLKEEKRIALRQEIFFDDAERNKKSFQEAIAKYIHRENILRRGHVEFIFAAMAKMQDFGVHKDLQVYKALFNVFPKDRFVAKTLWQIEFRHYPKQQDCGIDILLKMEKNAVIPDDELGYLIVKVFGLRSHVMRRYQRMMYWMPKFKNLNPYPMPIPLPNDSRQLALIALKRMSVDYETKIDLHEASELENSFDKTFVASAQCSKQIELLSRHPKETAIFVEGGFNVWLRDKILKYFILRADNQNKNTHNYQEEEDTDELLETIPFFQEPSKNIVPRPSVHEQDDGIILGMCITGSSSKDSLVSWIKFLERTNPDLCEIPVVFKLRTPEDAVTTVKDDPNEGSAVI